jgi:hypothetical protein
VCSPVNLPAESKIRDAGEASGVNDAWTVVAIHGRQDSDDPGAEFLIVMGLRLPMTLVTVTSLFGGMMKSGDRPFADTVAIPAVPSKQRLIKMTVSTLQQQ